MFHDLDATMMILVWNLGSAVLIAGIASVFGRSIFARMACNFETLLDIGPRSVTRATIPEKVDLHFRSLRQCPSKNGLRHQGTLSKSARSRLSS